jgi:hypothetical protein
MNTGRTDHALDLFDQILQETLLMRQAVARYKHDLKIRRATRPFAFNGLDDPKLAAYEMARVDNARRITATQREIERAAHMIQACEMELGEMIPRGIWIRHDWSGRAFAIGITLDGAFRCVLLHRDWDESDIPPMDTPGFEKPCRREWARMIERYTGHPNSARPIHKL